MFDRKLIPVPVVGLGLFLAAILMLKDVPESASWFSLDTGFHVAGGIFAAWCGSLFFKNKAKVFLLALVIGLVWELAEYLSSVYGQTYWPLVYRYYHGGGLVDTIDDLFADLLGMILFILLYYRHEK